MGVFRLFGFCYLLALDRFCDGFQAHAPATDCLFIVLFGQDRTDQANAGRAVRENAHHIGAAANFPVESLLRVDGPDLPPVFLRGIGKSQQFRAGIDQQMAGLGKLWQ